MVLSAVSFQLWMSLVRVEMSLVRVDSYQRHPWKLTADKHAATAVEHAADAEDLLRESFAYLKNVKAATTKLPAWEAKPIQQV